MSVALSVHEQRSNGGDPYQEPTYAGEELWFSRPQPPKTTIRFAMSFALFLPLGLVVRHA